MPPRYTGELLPGTYRSKYVLNLFQFENSISYLVLQDGVQAGQGRKMQGKGVRANFEKRKIIPFPCLLHRFARIARSRWFRSPNRWWSRSATTASRGTARARTWRSAPSSSGDQVHGGNETQVKI